MNADLPPYPPPGDCSIDGHITCGIPTKTCLRCGKRWLTGDPTTDEYEIESCEVYKTEPDNGYNFFGNLSVRNVKYKMERKND